MEKKRPLGIILISLYIIFIPIVLLLALKLIFVLNYTFSHSVMHPLKFLEVEASFSQSWGTNPILLILGLLLGIGVFYRNNAARLGAITFMGLKAIFELVSVITIYVNMGFVAFQYIAKKWGYDDAFLPLIMFAVFFLAYSSAVCYLTRPKVKEQFK